MVFSAVLELTGFLLYWVTDFIRETVYAIFRCRPRKDIKGENILITGTGQGIGRLVVDRLAKDGNTLHCVDIAAELNEKMKLELKDRDCTIYTYSCDVGEAENIAELGRKVKENTPDKHLTYLFNIAGIVIGKSFEAETEREMLKVMKVNVMGPLYLTKLVLPAMRDAGKGHIVNISSLAGIVGGPLIVDYCTSKFAVRGFTQSLLAEIDYLEMKGVKVTSIHPHITKTGMFNNTQAKWPLIFPLLEPEWVADQVVIATREEREQVNLPKMVNLTLICEHLMSQPTFRKYTAFLGTDTMKTFKKIRSD